MTTIRRPRLHQIVRAACDVTGANLQLVIGDQRTDNLVRVRRLIAWVARKHGYTTPEIGAVLGGRDHSTIVWSLSQIDLDLRGNQPLASLLEQIEAESWEHTRAWFERTRTGRIPDRLITPLVEAEPDASEASQFEDGAPPEAPREVGVGDIGPGWWSANDAHFRHAMRQAHPEMECAR